MTPDRLRECLTLLRWPQNTLADALACDRRLVQRWAAGTADYAIPQVVAEWLEQLAAGHVKYPAPTDWRAR